MQNRLREVRNKTNLTLSSYSRMIGIPPNTLSRYETGKREPKLETWEKLANFWEVSVPYLQGYVDEYIDIHDLNEEEQDAYNRITDMLCEEYPEDSISWAKIGQLLINSAEE
ncbi:MULTISPECIES: helix-turn-helix domain-containing protein [Lactobacillus]|jgi:hypothetical protein|nr:MULTISPECIES: helix-turn-helix transcriptional regulator [Lactobacillus]KDA99153.1 XRE family transcriptional regulator [Lactobacillus paragasseri K7]MBO3729645.1 helix-turn-helix transcriptional regulator [Lactobacillus paragasseri]MCT7704429.1 helix-turn-helix domain-containing protein [Lactobacillus gasseri]MDK7886059.1 helix-turn-helix transcriptional regulator [Lactobacillus gasseri]MDT9589170.1 helix-turn-helix transcriptional regulator [Lactobacillus paragasseri]